MKENIYSSVVYAPGRTERSMKNSGSIRRLRLLKVGLDH